MSSETTDEQDFTKDVGRKSKIEDFKDDFVDEKNMKKNAQSTAE